jgi:hypothetical protein
MTRQARLRIRDGSGRLFCELSAGNVKSNVISNSLSTLIIEAANLNGFSILCLRTVLKHLNGQLIFFLQLAHDVLTKALQMIPLLANSKLATPSL